MLKKAVGEREIGGLRVGLMTVDSLEILNRFADLNTHRRGQRRAPHKPLLSLLALQYYTQGQTEILFTDLEPKLLRLLNTYAPPVRGKHQPELPFWYMRSDNIWHVIDADRLPRQSGGFPKKNAINKTSGGFTHEVIKALDSDPLLFRKIVELLLAEHFPPSIHEDLVAQIGLGENFSIKEPSPAYEIKRKRDPSFRENVLRAYEHRCAVTGFRAALGGSFFGCEAAHVQWHAFDGPDTLANGVCLEPTIHKLFDAGAWTMTDDHRILVSKDYTGSLSAVARLRENHGKTLAAPLKGEPEVDPEYIKWHREPELGGVFRHPPLDL